jgi:hypothetical protein
MRNFRAIKFCARFLPVRRARRADRVLLDDDSSLVPLGVVFGIKNPE